MSFLNIELQTNDKLVILFLLFVYLFNSISYAYAQDNYKYFVLDNGLKVYLIKNNNPIATHLIVYNIGSNIDLSYKGGSSYLLQRLFSNGTNKYPKDKLESLVAGEGGSHGSTITRDLTFYYTTVHRSYIYDIIDLEADRMVWIQIDDDTFNEEKEKLNEELVGISSNNNYGIMEDFYRLSYPKFGYGRPIKGSKSTIINIMLQDVIDIYNKWYTPSNATVYIIGDVSFDELEKYIRSKYSRISKRYLKLLLGHQKEIPYNYNLTISYNNNSDNNEIIVSYLVPSYFSDDSRNNRYSYSLFLLSKILQSKSNDFYQNLVGNKGVLSNLEVNYNFHSKSESLFYIKAEFESKYNKEHVQSRILLELENAINKVTLKDMQNASRKIRDELEFLKDDDIGYLIEFAQYIASGLKIEDLLNLTNILESIDENTVISYGNAMINTKTVSVIINGK